jgi:hypothetical protein
LAAYAGYTQTKSALLQKHFLGLPVTEQFEYNISLLKNDSRFGIDSITSSAFLFILQTKEN